MNLRDLRFDRERVGVHISIGYVKPTIFRRLPEANQTPHRLPEANKCFPLPIFAFIAVLLSSNACMNQIFKLFYLFLILKYFFLQLVSFCLLRQIAEIWRIIFLIPGTARLKPCLWPITDTKWATNVMINNFGTRPMTSANVSKNYISSIILSMMRITNIVTYFFSKIKTIIGRLFLIWIVSPFVHFTNSWHLC